MTITARLAHALKLALNDSAASRQLIDLLNNLSGGTSAAPWVALTPETGFDGTHPGGAPEYRIVGDRVELRGGVNSTTGEQGLAALLVTMPAEARPGALKTFPANYLSGGPLAGYAGAIFVATNGQVTLNQNDGGSGSVKLVSLSGIWWPVGG